MNTAITQGVKISVKTMYRENLSDLKEKTLLFNYAIEIENQNLFTIQLKSRHWRIFDSLNAPRYVDGEGVVGEQPSIKPGGTYFYRSGCDLTSELGFMEGFYDFVQLNEKQEKVKSFRVKVPRFYLQCPFKLN